MQQFLEALGRKTTVVNLDPANDGLPYQCGVDINQLITLTQVMNQFELGPNGGLMYCMEYLEKNFDWLLQKLEAYKGYYFLFDCPGQVELYTHHHSARAILKLLEKHGYKVTCVHLVDSYYCSTAANYIAATLLSLSTMLHLELPHVNVLSKIDLVHKFGKLEFGLEFYTDVTDLSFLQKCLDNDKVTSKYKKLNATLSELIEDFGLVSFSTLNIEDKESVLKLLKIIDKANGYIYSGLPTSTLKIPKLDVPDIDFEYYRVANIQEKYMEDQDEDSLAQQIAQWVKDEEEQNKQ
uniref:GPN-loop GTPase 2 n=1 Tax=Arcella intermedia TaxID=1963864 RepID=A0A6B2LAK2_9EUKA